jgi:hypothetical protein
MNRLGSTALLLATLLVSSSGSATDPRLLEADLAWDRGDYPTALNGYLTLLDVSDSDHLLEPIALQTGELFRSIELTADGGAPRFSPDGRHITYEIGRGVARRTRLVAVDSAATVISVLPGFGAAFSPDGTELAYLQLDPTDAMREIERAADAVSGEERTKRLAALAALTEPAARIVVRNVASGMERIVDLGKRRKNTVLLGADRSLLFTGSEGEGPDQVYVVAPGREPEPVTTGDPAKALQEINATGTAALYTHRLPAGRGGGGRENTPPRFGVVSLPERSVTVVEGSAPAFSPDGRQLAYVNRVQDRSHVMLASTETPATATSVRSGPERLDDPALSQDGRRLVFQMMARDDWEIYVVNRDGTGEARVTREIQHDVAPRFLPGDRLLGLIGEPRHRRSYLYDLSTGTRTRVFHNNTVRTIAPEYEWTPSPDGTKLLIVAERDGNTVSPERGVYLMDLTKKVSRADLQARVRSNLAAEQRLRAKGVRLFAPIADAVRRVVDEVSIERIFSYEKALFDFDSKHITRPGNKLASAYLFEAYKSFGYAPEYQWFAGRGALGGRTANVVARLPGTLHPELVYVVSSHYDSVAGGPGADDDSSGTAALLETARILARHPQPATLLFASFTGEESGLLGSREFVRRAVADKVQIVGALNNDMIGWTNDHRLDNTIRYSNPGIRDVQHAAALQFTRLITYDALYYKGTDAYAYYETYGDIVGGIGSYPVLGNPHYHQPHDLLDTINHQLVAEVAKTTAATLMLLASSPSRVKDLRIDRSEHGSTTLSWRPSLERDVTGYIVTWGDIDDPEAPQVRVKATSASIKVPSGATVAVKAVNQRGLEGWDWAEIRVGETVAGRRN